jgi:hypothetical protein
MVFAWFAVGNFFLVFQILTTSLGAPELLGNTEEVLSVAIEWVYLGSLITCFVLSLGNKPEGSKIFYLATVCIWAGIMMSVFSMSKELRKLMTTCEDILSSLQYSSLLSQFRRNWGTNSLRFGCCFPTRSSLLLLCHYCWLTCAGYWSRLHLWIPGTLPDV